MAPELEKVATAHGDKVGASARRFCNGARSSMSVPGIPLPFLLAHQVAVTKVDTDRYPGLCARYSIKGLPTLVLFKDGKEVRHACDVTRKAEVVSACLPLLRRCVFTSQQERPFSGTRRQSYEDRLCLILTLLFFSSQVDRVVGLVKAEQVLAAFQPFIDN